LDQHPGFGLRFLLQVPRDPIQAVPKEVAGMTAKAEVVRFVKVIADDDEGGRPASEKTGGPLWKHDNGFAFPADLTVPALTQQSQPLTEAERAEAQRWALELSQIADPRARQARLATAPAHWQPTIRHYLAWRVGMSALRATLRKAEPSTGIK
jgi:hypothetical protein